MSGPDGGELTLADLVRGSYELEKKANAAGPNVNEPSANLPAMRLAALGA